MPTSLRAIAVDAEPPGVLIKKALVLLDLTPNQLARKLGANPRYVQEILTGDVAVTPEIARGLQAELGPPAELWLELEQQYRISRLRRGPVRRGRGPTAH